MRNEKRLTYAMAVVETRILEKRLIGMGVIKGLLREQSPKSTEAALRAAGYPGITLGVLDKDNFDALLRGALEGFAQEVLNIAPDPEIIDLLFLEYDIFNIKAVLMHKDPGIRFERNLTRIPADRAIRYRFLSEGTDPEEDSLWDALFVEAKELYREKGAKAVQEMLDLRYCKELLGIAERSGVPLCLQYAKAKIDFYNILSMLRLTRLAAAQAHIPDEDEMRALHRRILAPGGMIALETLEGMCGAPIQQWILLADGTLYRDHLMQGLREYSYGTELTSLERCMDDCLTQMMKRYQSVALGPEPLLGYLHGRRIEILNLRLVLTSFFLGVPRHTVAERLRECYA